MIKLDKCIILISRVDNMGDIMEYAYIEDNNKSKKRIFLLVLIGVLIIFLLIISGSYAFFRIQQDTTKTNTRGTITLECVNIEYVEEGNINLPNAYPITDAYALSHNKPVTVKITNNCDSNFEQLNYSLVLTTLSNGDNNITSDKIRLNAKLGVNSTELTDLLQPTYLSSLPTLTNEYSIEALNADVLSREGFDGYTIVDSHVIDENFVKNNGTNTYELKIWLDYYEGDSDAYNNKPHNPSFDNTTKNKSYIGALSIVANPYEQHEEPPKTNLDIAREKDETGALADVGGMYRYQGTEDVNNYICLGEDCAENGNDLYRIIGITRDGEIKVIKKTALTDLMQWHIDRTTDTEWPDSDLFHQLNDYAESDYGSHTYDSTSFYSKLSEQLKPYIVKKDWMYGDIDLDYESADMYNGNKMYAIETGGEPTTHREKNENDNNYTEQPYTWENTVSAYIGLQYIHDYIYAYPGGEPGDYTTAKNAWINISHNDSSKSSEWFISRYGYSSSGRYHARTVASGGDVNHYYLTSTSAVRPVFYLSSDVALSGEGTLDVPYTIF